MYAQGVQRVAEVPHFGTVAFAKGVGREGKGNKSNPKLSTTPGLFFFFPFLIFSLLTFYNSVVTFMIRILLEMVECVISNNSVMLLLDPHPRNPRTHTDFCTETLVGFVVVGLGVLGDDPAPSTTCCVT